MLRPFQTCFPWFVGLAVMDPVGDPSFSKNRERIVVHSCGSDQDGLVLLPELDALLASKQAVALFDPRKPVPTSGINRSALTRRRLQRASLRPSFARPSGCPVVTANPAPSTSQAGGGM